MVFLQNEHCFLSKESYHPIFRRKKTFFRRSFVQKKASFRRKTAKGYHFFLLFCCRWRNYAWERGWHGTLYERSVTQGSRTLSFLGYINVCVYADIDVSNKEIIRLWIYLKFSFYKKKIIFFSFFVESERNIETAYNIYPKAFCRILFRRVVPFVCWLVGWVSHIWVPAIPDFQRPLPQPIKSWFQSHWQRHQ